MIRVIPTVGLLAFVLCPEFSIAQTVPVSDPQALSLAAQSMKATTGGMPVSDVTLSGSVTWVSGSETMTGQGTFVAKGLAQSRVSLSSSSATRTDIRNTTDGTPQAEWLDSDGNGHEYANHNCMTDPVWFFPPLSSLSGTDPAVVLSYIGLENRRGVQVQHIHAYRYTHIKNALTMALRQRLSTIDFYLEATSLLPVAITFSIHPDNDAGTDLPVEVVFSSYQPINGVQVPMHVREYVRGMLMLDFIVASAVTNSGVLDTTFSIQ